MLVEQVAVSPSTVLCVMAHFGQFLPCTAICNSGETQKGGTMCDDVNLCVVTNF